MENNKLPDNILKLSGSDATTYVRTKVMIHMPSYASALSHLFVKDWLEDSRYQFCYLKFRDGTKRELLSFVLLVKEKENCHKQFSFACCRNVCHQDLHDLVNICEQPNDYQINAIQNLSNSAEIVFQYFKKYQLSHNNS